MGQPRGQHKTADASPDRLRVAYDPETAKLIAAFVAAQLLIGVSGHGHSPLLALLYAYCLFAGRALNKSRARGMLCVALLVEGLAGLWRDNSFSAWELAVHLGAMLLFFALGQYLSPAREQAETASRKSAARYDLRYRASTERQRGSVVTAEPNESSGQAGFEQFSLTLVMLRRLLGLHTCALYVVEPSGELSLVRGASLSHVPLKEKVEPGRGCMGATVSQRQMVQQRVNAGSAKHSAMLPYYTEAQPVQQVLCLPITRAAEVVGVLCLDKAAPSAFGDEAKRAATEASEAAALALSESRRIRRFEQSEHQRSVLYDASERFASARDEATIIDAATTAIRAVTDFDFVAVTRSRDKGQDGRQRIVYAAGDGAERYRGIEVSNDRSLCHMSLTKGCVLPYRGTFDASRQTLFRGVGDLAHLGYLWVFPLVSRGKAQGTIVVARERPWHNAESTRTTLELLSSQVAMALSNADLVTELEALATTDALTGCRNKRSFLSDLSSKMQSAKRFGRPLSLLVTDLDFFKKVNDTYGHAVGDEVLKAFAGILAEARRQTDVVARFGGEEFCVLCEETDLAGASLLAERIRRELAGGKITTKAGLLEVTCSIGVACFPEHADSEEALFEHADAALYAAKGAGRNRVETERRAVSAVHRAIA